MPSNVLNAEEILFEHENSKILELNNNVLPLDLNSSDLHEEDEGEVVNIFYTHL